jgi:transcriptional regulator with XRE-family HTH domain
MKNCWKGEIMGGKELRAAFGKNVKDFRRRRNWSQADLAEYANISIDFLGDIERGKKWPHPDTLTKLADALEIKVFELFLEEDTKVNPRTQTMMSRFVKDVSLTINKSLSLSVNQSIDHIRKQYRLKK